MERRAIKAQRASGLKDPWDPEVYQVGFEFESVSFDISRVDSSSDVTLAVSKDLQMN